MKRVVLPTADSLPVRFVRVTLRVGPNGKVVQIWAQRLSQGHYRKVNTQGEWGYDNKDRRYICGEGDIIKEEPAVVNKKYGNLEVEE